MKSIFLHFYLFTVTIPCLSLFVSPYKSIITSNSVSLCVFSLFFWLLVTLIVMCPPQTLFPQHFREHLDKLFAQGIGMLDIALTEAFNLLSDVS